MGFRLRVAAPVGIVLLAALLYSDTLQHPFVLDDVRNIAGNPAIRWQQLDADSVLRAAVESPTPRAVANISFGLNYLLGGADPAAYRAVNIAIHGLCGVLVYALALALYRRATALGAAPAVLASGPSRQLVALFAALLFVAHPLQTQSVTYVVQRMNSLAACFYLLALLAWMRGRGSPLPKRRAAWWAATALCWMLGAGSKETVAVLPFAIWLIEWAFYRDLDSRWARRSGLVLVAGAAAAVVVFALHPDGLARFEGRGFTPGERLLTQFRVFWLYVGLILLPLPSRQNLIYDFPLSRSLLDPASTLLSLLGLVALAGLAALLLRRHRLAAFGVVWLLLHLALESSVLPLAMVYEHRTYLPLAGVAIGVAPLIFRLAGTPARATVLTGAIVLALGTATHVRNQVWSDPVTLWSDVVAKSPDSSRAHDELGLALAGADRLEEAFDHYATAVRLDPPKPDPHLHLGYTLVQLGYPDEGMERMQLVLEIDPDNAPAHNAIGLTWMDRGRVKLAAAHLARAVNLAPEHANHHNSLGVALDRLGRSDEARSHYRRAVALDPRHSKAYANLGEMAAREGRDPEAIHFSELAHRFDRRSVVARNNLAWLLATSADPALHDAPRAIELAESLQAEGEEGADLLDTLAAAYAAAGRFEDAIPAATRAVSQARTSGKAALAAEIRDRLDLYRRGQAHVGRSAHP